MSQVNVTKYSDSPLMARSPLPSLPFALASEMPSLNPISLMRRFTEEMDRLFGSTGTSHGEMELWAPAIEVSERDGRLVVSADLPGLRKEDVKVEIARDTLILQGERKQAHEEKHDGYSQSERSYGRFYRAIALPEGANIDKASAEMANGTLEISIPVPETRTSRRQIPVQESKSRTSPPN